ncbi:MAG: hypothetical protein ACRC2V_01890, partial [Xenococcaceae cyanobacterium]
MKIDGKPIALRVRINRFIRLIIIACVILSIVFSDDRSLSNTKNSSDRSVTQYIAAKSSIPRKRDKWLWPFSSNSIWNLPIGSKAVYLPAKLTKAGYLSADREYFYRLNAND